MFSLSKQPVSGFVKTHHRQYLNRPEHLAVLDRLESGSRSPMFRFGEGVASGYSWYVRLALCRAIEYSLAGVIRLEVSMAIDREEAIRLADLSTSFVGGPASSLRRDHRSPHNLHPLSSLEDGLHYRLATELGCLWAFR